MSLTEGPVLHAGGDWALLQGTAEAGVGWHLVERAQCYCDCAHNSIYVLRSGRAGRLYSLQLRQGPSAPLHVYHRWRAHIMRSTIHSSPSNQHGSARRMSVCAKVRPQTTETIARSVCSMPADAHATGAEERYTMCRMNGEQGVRLGCPVHGLAICHADRSLPLIQRKDHPVHASPRLRPTQAGRGTSSSSLEGLEWSQTSADLCRNWLNSPSPYVGAIFQSGQQGFLPSLARLQHRAHAAWA